jgi:hypothetical protein
LLLVIVEKTARSHLRAYLRYTMFVCAGSLSYYISDSYRNTYIHLSYGMFRALYRLFEMVDDFVMSTIAHKAMRLYDAPDAINALRKRIQ